MVRRTRRGVERHRQQQRGSPEVPERRGREVRRVGPSAAGSGRSPADDKPIASMPRSISTAWSPRPLGSASPRQLPNAPLLLRPSPRLLRERPLGGPGPARGGALGPVRGLEQRGLARGGRARLPQHHRAVDQVALRELLGELRAPSSAGAAAVGRHERQRFRVRGGRSSSTSSSRVAVAAALDAAPGPLAESRGP